MPPVFLCRLISRGSPWLATLARYKGPSREHTESDLRCYLTWCAERGLDPLAPGGRTWSCTSGGCEKSATSSPPPPPADPRATMRCDRARYNLDQHPNYILAAYMASGT